MEFLSRRVRSEGDKFVIGCLWLKKYLYLFISYLSNLSNYVRFIQYIYIYPKIVCIYLRSVYISLDLISNICRQTFKNTNGFRPHEHLIARCFKTPNPPIPSVRSPRYFEFITSAGDTTLRCWNENLEFVEKPYQKISTLLVLLCFLFSSHSKPCRKQCQANYIA